MMKIKKQKGGRSKYRSISSSERALIIHYIEEYKYSTSHVSMITGHNASTIKAIYQVYKKEGRVHKKDKRDKVLNVVTQLQLYMVDDTNLSLTSIDTSKYEKTIINDQDKDLKQTFNKEVLSFLEKNQFKISPNLDNSMAIETFNNQFNLIKQQKDISQQFKLLDFNQTVNSPDRQETKLTISKKLEKNQETKNIQYPQENFKSMIFSILEEQFKQMKNQ